MYKRQRDTYGNSFLWAMGNLTKRRFGAEMTGKFTTVDYNEFKWVGGTIVPVEPGDCPSPTATANSSKSQQQRLDNSASKIDKPHWIIESVKDRAFNYEPDNVKSITLTLEGQKPKQTVFK